MEKSIIYMREKEASRARKRMTIKHKQEHGSLYTVAVCVVCCEIVC